MPLPWDLITKKKINLNKPIVPILALYIHSMYRFVIDACKKKYSQNIRFDVYYNEHIKNPDTEKSNKLLIHALKINFPVEFS